jgi:diguanylate cyclase (GGDEF)-like protein
MKIGGTPRYAQVTRTGKTGSAERTEKSDGARAAAAPAPAEDSMSIMGIPEAELTAKVRTALMTLMREVEQLRRDLNGTKARLTELEREADLDTLTPLANRRAFVRELSRVMSFTERYGGGASLIYFDVNNLKTINDTHGHAAGDEALLKVADVIVKNVRESDVVGRLGGDEFGVILAQSDSDKALEKAESLSDAIGQSTLEWEGTTIPLAVAFGVHTFKAGDDVSKALAEADRAMYRRKQLMKNGTPQ